MPLAPSTLCPLIPGFLECCNMAYVGPEGWPRCAHAPVSSPCPPGHARLAHLRCMVACDTSCTLCLLVTRPLPMLSSMLAGLPPC